MAATSCCYRKDGTRSTSHTPTRTHPTRADSGHSQPEGAEDQRVKQRVTVLFGCDDADENDDEFMSDCADDDGDMMMIMMKVMMMIYCLVVMMMLMVT